MSPPEAAARPVGPPEAAAPSRVGRGIVAMILAMALFSSMDAVIKHLRTDYTALQIVFFRMAFGAVPMLALIHAEGGLPALVTRRLPAHLMRSVLTLAALVCFFHSFRLLPLADAYAITYAAPLIATALSLPLLGERVDARRWAAVLVGLAGVIVILRPGGGVLSGGGMIALAGAALLAVNVVLLRQLSRTETNAAIVFYFTVVGTLASGVLMPFVWRWPEGTDWAWLIAVGLIGGLGQICITEALRQAPVAVVSPFQYSQLLWGTLFGFVVFDDLPGGAVIVGAAIVVACGLYVLQRETAAAHPRDVRPG